MLAIIKAKEHMKKNIKFNYLNQDNENNETSSFSININIHFVFVFLM